MISILLFSLWSNPNQVWVLVPSSMRISCRAAVRRWTLWRWWRRADGLWCSDFGSHRFFLQMQRNVFLTASPEIMKLSMNWKCLWCECDKDLSQATEVVLTAQIFTAVKFIWNVFCPIGTKKPTNKVKVDRKLSKSEFIDLKPLNKRLKTKRRKNTIKRQKCF